jgi:hypothetical protein
VPASSPRGIGVKIMGLAAPRIVGFHGIDRPLSADILPCH